MAIAAYTATVKNGSNTIQDIMSVELSFKMDQVETTAFGGSGGATVGAKTYLPTLLGLQMKLTGNWNKSDTTGQLALENAFFGRTLVSLVVAPSGSSNTYSFSAWVTDYTVKSEVKGVVTADYSLTMNGGVTIV